MNHSDYLYLAHLLAIVKRKARRDDSGYWRRSYRALRRAYAAAVERAVREAMRREELGELWEGGEG